MAQLLPGYICRPEAARGKRLFGGGSFVGSKATFQIVVGGFIEPMSGILIGSR